MQTDTPDIMALIAQAPWREAVTYRYTWPHEYVVVKKDRQQDLLAAFCTRIACGEESSAGSSVREGSISSWASTSTGR